MTSDENRLLGLEWLHLENVSDMKNWDRMEIVSRDSFLLVIQSPPHPPPRRHDLSLSSDHMI